MTKLPRWDCRNARDQQLMKWWVNGELNLLDNEELSACLLGERALNPPNYLAWLIEQADLGDIGPLRVHYPHLARFLQLPKKTRGQRFSKVGRYDPVLGAVADVKRIRALWVKHYGKRNRPKNDAVTAEQIAADRWEIDVESVISRLKKTPSK